MLRAATEEQEVVVQRLLENNAELKSKNNYNQTPLSLAAEEGYKAIMKLLLSQDDMATDSRDEYNQTPLSRAAKKGYKTIIKLLLNQNDMITDFRNKSD